MSILAWLVLGLIAGFIGSKIVNNSGQGLILDIVGAVVGGYLFTLFGAAPVTGLDLYSMLVAIVGAVVVLVLFHMIAGNRRTI